MMYWPRPTELQFRLSQRAAKARFEVVEASILSVDRCWRGSVPNEYIPHTKTYHIDEIDQTARDYVLKNPDRLEIPEVMMLGNSHLAFTSGDYVFVLLREMADLGYLDAIPFAVPPWDAEKFRYYFRPKEPELFVEEPMLALMGVEDD